MEKAKKNPSGITSAETFKKLAEERKGTLVELPSGIVVKIGKPFVSDMVAAGEIPGELINIALGQKTQGETDKETAAKTSKLMNHLVAKAVLEPKIVLEGEPDYDKGEISIKDISDFDRTFIYTHVQEGVVNRLNKFRDEQPGTTSGSNSKPVSGDAPQPAPKHK